MKAKRIYGLLFLATIALGLASRKVPLIPAITGDILYATMAYWLFRIIATKKSMTSALITAILFCVIIECLQLVQLQPLVWARNHPLLRLILGQGFLWTDLLAYFVGALAAFILDTKWIQRATKPSSL